MKQSKPSIHYRSCNLCEAMCGIVVEVEDKQVVSIKGDPADPFSKGYICPKATALKDLHEDPDRLRTPIMKTEEGWKEVSWNRAFDIIGNRIRKIRSQHGRDAIGAYLGNPNVHHHGNLLFGLGFLEALQTRNRFSATSNDQLPHMRANLEMFGHQLLFPVPDIDHTDFFVLLGSNPAASNGSLMSAPDYLGRLKRLRKRGGKAILIDPRKTETARVCDEHIFIRPGSDALLMLGILHTLFDEGLVETGRLSANIDDIAQIQLICSDFSADYVSPLTGIASDTIRQLARDLANTPRAALFGRMGTSTQEFGTLATWLIYVVNTLTNHLDERGGLMFTKPAADMVEIGAMIGQKGHADRFRSKSGLPEFGGELPASCMADQIELPGDDQIKAMFVIAGNPVLSSPNGKRLDAALASLDFMVSIDCYLNETSRHADIILPPTSQLEQSHYDLAFNLVSVRNVAKFSPPLFKPPRNARHDWQILLELTRRLAGKDLSSRLQMEAIYQVLRRLGPDGILDILLRTGPYGTQIPGTTQVGAFLIDAIQDLLSPEHPVRKLLDLGPYGPRNRALSKGLCTASLQNYPHGIDLGSLQTALPARLFTPGKRIRLAPAAFIKDMSRLRRHAELLHSTEPSDKTLLLIGRRDVRSNNSWMHNSRRLVKGKNRCTVLVHPEDAKRAGLTSGEMAEINSRVGKLEIEVEISDKMMEGVISIPHGWGHSYASTRLSEASRRPGVSVNDLTDDTFVDRLGGTSALNGVPVRMSKVKSSAPTKGNKRSTNNPKPVRRKSTQAKTA